MVKLRKWYGPGFVLKALVVVWLLGISGASAVVYELRSYRATAGKAEALHQQFRDHNVELLTKHGMEPLAFWRPLNAADPVPDLVVLLRHQTMEAAGASWRWLEADPDWRALQKAGSDGPLLARKPTSEYLRATDDTLRFVPGAPRTPSVFELRRSGGAPRQGTLVGSWESLPAQGKEQEQIVLLRHENGLPEETSRASLYLKLTDYTPVITGKQRSDKQTAAARTEDWQRSYKTPYIDANGIRVGGSEVVHIVAHKGKLFAFNGYWGDKMCGHQSSQVVRLDRPEADWQVDLETTKSALKYTKGNLLHIKGNILKSITFTTDKHGNAIHTNLLFAASWAFNTNLNLDQAVSVFLRDDQTGTWSHELLMDGSRFETDAAGKKRKFRRTPRDVEVYRDPVTGIEKIFLLVGDPGVLAGVFNAETGRIEWEDRPEHPQDGSTFKARPLGLTAANGRLYFSVGGSVFVRNNGPKPTWSEVFSLGGRVNTDVGGIRGLSTVKNPNGAGESLIFIWLPRGRSEGQIMRLDGPVHTPAKETTLRHLFDRQQLHGGAKSTGSLGAYNTFYPLTDPRTGESVHLFGYQQTVSGLDEAYIWNTYYGGALYGIRRADGTYSSGTVNGLWSPNDPPLVAPRTFCLSPFPDEKDVLYIGGFDSNFKRSSDCAWIFKADFSTVLGYE